MAIVRFNPFRDLDQLQREMNRMFDEWPSRGEGRDRDLSSYDWAPSVDVYEDGNALVVTAELAGLTEKDVKVGIENGILTLSGEKKFENEKIRDKYQRIECAYGSFSRSFTLPGNIDVEKISAKMENGVLRVMLPKKEEARPKQIEIKVGK